MAEPITCGKRGQADPNFCTNVRYRVERLVLNSREHIEQDIKFACAFGTGDVEWFEYRAIRLDVDEGYVVFEVKGRNYVPLPEDGNIEQIKDALL